MVETKLSADFGSQIRAKLLEFESKAKIKLSKNQRILLAEVGTVEQTLSLILNAPIIVSDIEQKVEGDWITRSVWLGSDENKVLHAKTEYYKPNIPEVVLRAIEHTGIGSALTHYDIDTRRRIVEFGYDKEEQNHVWRRYEIWHETKILFDITESFALSEEALL